LVAARSRRTGGDFFTQRRTQPSRCLKRPVSSSESSAQPIAGNQQRVVADGSIVSHDSEKKVISIQSQGDIKVKSKKSVIIDSAKAVTIKAAESVDIEAMTVIIKAGNLNLISPGVSMKTSGNSMIIDAGSTHFTGNVAISGVVSAKNIA